VTEYMVVVLTDVMQGSSKESVQKEFTMATH